MLKLRILNMKRFLETVNTCVDAVIRKYPDGSKENINRRDGCQSRLIEEYEKNGKCLLLWIEILNPHDYFKIVNYYLGDC